PDQEHADGHRHPGDMSRPVKAVLLRVAAEHQPTLGVPAAERITAGSGVDAAPWRLTNPPTTSAAMPQRRCTQPRARPFLASGAAPAAQAQATPPSSI